MKNFIFILLLLILSFQSSLLTSKRHSSHQSNLEEYLNLLEKQLSNGNKNNYYKRVKYTDSNTEVDPNDHINIDLWNKLNAKDMKNMPETNDYSSEIAATHWLEWYARISKRTSQIGALLEWNYETNITEENQKALTAQSLLNAPFGRIAVPIGKKFNKYMKDSENEDLKRIYGRLALGTVDNNDEDVTNISKLHGQMEDIYATTTVCEPNNATECYTLAPYLERLMQIEKDYDRLTWAWKGWYDGCGDKIRPVYLPYIDLLNKNVKENGYNNLADYWIAEYEMGNSTQFERIIDQILEDIMPLYRQLHAYVRGRLCSMYPDRFDCNGPIPAHLLGNMWAQTWHDRYDDLAPYPNTKLVNVTRALLKKKFTINQMYTTAEKFYTSIGLYPMTPKFWARSMFKKPTDRAAVCHASATSMIYHEDYRVKICTEINDDYFYTIHHEMGHVEYDMAYEKNQPYVYQDGANSGFHEAIGDTIGIYAISPTHLVKLGFLDEEDIDSHYEINYLMRLALQKVAFLPFSYALDKYRFLLFRDEIDREHELNSMWWALRIEHGGVMAAVQRSDATNFDPGAKYHVPSNVPYLRYFIAHILQFQFYRAMCRIHGQTEKLHLCDIYGDKKVGERFEEMLAMGDSKSWSTILEILTGENKLEPQAMLDFFEPLYKWLKAENLARGYPVGWM